MELPDAERAGVAATPMRLPRGEAVILGIALVVITALAALYTVAGVGMKMSAVEMTAMSTGAAQGGMAMEGGAMPGMSGMAGMAMQPPAWTAGYAALVFLMWWVMMIAMMTPAAAPVVLLYARLKRQTQPRSEAMWLTALFLAGYLLIWAAFSLLATGAQWMLELRGLVSPAAMSVTSATLGGAILIAAGLYQLSPLKHACLDHCRHPAQVLTRRPRPGRGGAVRLGLEHGAFCLGCCWMLMALLFFGGIMNLYWIAGLATLVIVEKLVPGGPLLARVTGVGLICGGLWLIAGA